MSDERLFHITDSGRLSPTGEIAHYSWFSLPVLRCVICGQEMDASDYDIVGPNAWTDAHGVHLIELDWDEPLA